MHSYDKRFYRDWMDGSGLVKFDVKIKDSDLFILCDRDLRLSAHTKLLQTRSDLESYIKSNRKFYLAMDSCEVEDDAPQVAQTMAAASARYDVGPMAAVAGAFAETIGRWLLQSCNTVIVENGGDVFARADEPVQFALYAGEKSPFSNKIHFKVNAKDGCGICTSSKAVGPSLSFGNADAVVAVAESTALADAAATAIANKIKGPECVEKIINEGTNRDLLKALIVCAGDKIAFWGDITLN